MRSRGIPLAIVIVLAAGPLAACASRAIATAARQSGPQPLDPLSADERALAEKFVRADTRARDLLEGSWTLASVEFLAMKGAGPEDVIRHAELLFSRPDAGFGVRALVRLGAEPTVIELTRVDVRSMPVTDAEVQEAWRVALGDATYRARLSREVDRLRPEALRIYTEDPKDPCYAGRCLYLMVRDGAYYVSSASVAVDLASRRILAERSPR